MQYAYSLSFSWKEVMRGARVGGYDGNIVQNGPIKSTRAITGQLQ